MELPSPTRKRLVELLQYLKTCTSPKLTSKDISEALGYKDTLIRYDLKYLSLTKGSSNGYSIPELIKAINSLVDSSRVEHRCCIVGLGKLGQALLDDNFFEGSPFKVVAGFDSNVNRTEILRATFPLYPASRIEQIVKGDRIEYAILTVPDSQVPIMTERLVKSGILGIVNYTTSILSVSESIKVINVSPITALLNMSIGV